MKWSQRFGFSLIELVLAFGLISIAILGLIGVFASGVELSANSRDVAAATQVGREVLERVKLHVEQVGFGYLPAGSYTFDGSVPDLPTGSPAFPPPPYQTTGLNNQEFVLRVEGTELSPTLKEIRVTVTWEQTKKIVLETRLHR